jgi:hypothetical protein
VEGCSHGFSLLLWHLDRSFDPHHQQKSAPLY